MHEKQPFFINMTLAKITSKMTIIPTTTTSAPITTPTVQGRIQSELLEDTVLVGVLDSIANNNNNNNYNCHIVLISDEQGLIIIVEGEY